MRVFAYCAKDYEQATRRAAGVPPVCCPPVWADTLNLSLLEDNDLLFFNLHSLAGVPAFLGSKNGPPIALRATQLAEVDLGGAVVFAENCFLGDREHPMRDALLAAGASAVIAGAGLNYGSTGKGLKGADLLGLWVRRGLQVGLSAALALSAAKVRLRLAALRSAAARDALEFQMYRRA